MNFDASWNNRVLIVDDQEEMHQDFEEMLNPRLIEASTDELVDGIGLEEEESFMPELEIMHATSGERAFEIIKSALEDENPIAVAYIDIRMPPGWDGVETTRRIREIDKNIQIVMMTAHTDRSLPEIMQNMELIHKLLYIRKPCHRESVQQMTISLVEKWNVERELADKTRQIELSQQRLAAVLDSTRDSIAMFDFDGSLLFANKSYWSTFGLDENAANELSSEELRQKIKACFQEPDAFERADVLSQGNTLGEVIELKRPVHRILYQYASPVLDAGGNNTGHIVVYRDISKEIEIDQMKEEVLNLRAELEKEYSFDNIIGKSKKMREVYSLMKQAIKSDITVLIRGESGTGKELVAKSIHFNSPRKSGTFVAVNCAAIPETLIESELFGHERGAFTGASARRIGKFEQANGGTILLDEIGEMHPALQARLLRVLQEREIQRIGGTNTIPVDVRVIASTNKDLEAAIKEGTFREDLFYRIAAFPIYLPPLREHPEDIPILAEHFLSQASERSGKSITVISSEALQLLMNYNWPGNVRELENVIERAVLLETSGVLKASSLPEPIRSGDKQSRSTILLGTDGNETVEVLPLDEVERAAIIHALKATGDNIRQTARLLGINRATVYRKLEKYSLLPRK